MDKADDPRPGETRRDPPRIGEAVVHFIGRCRTPYATRADCPRQGALDGPLCRLEIDPDWADALDGIERFARLDVLYWLDRSRRDLVTQNPGKDGALRGTFSLRSPVRPNPIGLARVALERREGAVLFVRGLDCIDGTPLVDIKPERCAYTPLAPAKAADRADG
ncbi:tRNA-Thr(GGU) m(6)t(6)A37 methyltransferase TsaA [Roseivivax lentus]|uniref:tRNA-Thr(GGU) m(6)t(6)A37 methyltransferase TsaA n=1 Tax=Roseivivax lentus TaxID=633194 RepID=A0A1N7NJD7_9RHOB|nr:tRNA (N6-threonylcarbamoyladenosine(37)-N6)-methyltransferase TrmO [Roseivivax lentus]SIS98422.1 tRNA-Thr(GGU) m(6)t(6)A37 methyltransferase TsaA [Roseivivax lentus]